MATQSKIMVTDYDFVTGETIKREASSQEIESFNVVNSYEETRRQADTAKAEAKAALLERLGITADEAALLLS